MPATNDDYDSPWKDAVERYFPEFLAFFFPTAYAEIDWSKGYTFLDKELQAIAQDAELGRRYVDKLARVTLLSGEENWIYVHVEVQGNLETGFGERVFIYNYRIFDKYRRPVASLVVLADDAPGWKPSSFGFNALGCRHSLEFPIVKLLDYVGQEDELLKEENPFALVTVAHLLTRSTRQDMGARYAAKLKLIRLLYERNWDRQRVIDLLTVIDWMMHLPAEMTGQLRQALEDMEEGTKMRYVTSFEQIGIEKGIEKGKAEIVLRQLSRRFGALSAEIEARVRTASSDQLDEWMDRLMDARALADVFDEPTTH